MAEPTLYERLGGIFAIAAVVDHFSDQLLQNPKVVEANPELNEWHTAKYPGRLPGLKFLRTLWVASLAGGPSCPSRCSAGRVAARCGRSRNPARMGGCRGS